MSLEPSKQADSRPSSARKIGRQAAEQRIHNPQVVGSSPTSATSSPSPCRDGHGAWTGFLAGWDQISSPSPALIDPLGNPGHLSF
jgi:hypothetical protein